MTFSLHRLTVRQMLRTKGTLAVGVMNYSHGPAHDYKHSQQPMCLHFPDASVFLYPQVIFNPLHTLAPCTYSCSHSHINPFEDLTSPAHYKYMGPCSACTGHSQLSFDMHLLSIPVHTIPFDCPIGPDRAQIKQVCPCLVCSAGPIKQPPHGQPA